ncbi:dephospho-CoA kinase, partial [Staphylococcus aureus]|nr:dephospho-CoA kinase [Staphylococcus aureus]
MPNVIGLTGGIASGKSSVSELLSVFGFNVVDADNAAREAVFMGCICLAQVRYVFGDEAI